MFEEVLPYEKFTVRVLESDIPRIPTIIDSLLSQPEKIAAMQKELECVNKARTESTPCYMHFAHLFCCASAEPVLVTYEVTALAYI